MLPWLVTYALVLIVWALVIARRSDPTLWKGSSLVIVNSVFVLASIIYGFLKSNSLSTPGAVLLPRSLIFFDVVLVVIALLVARKWVLIGITHEEAAEILERCFIQTRSSTTRRHDHYVVKCGDLEMIAGISKNRVAIGNLHLPLRGHSISFAGAHASKKARLIRSLFSKHFNNSFPTPRIRA